MISVSSNFDTSHTFSLKIKILDEYTMTEINHDNKQNQMFPHWSNNLKYIQANTHVCIWTFRSWPTVNPIYKHWDQRQRQISAAGSIYPSLVHLLDFSIEIHASARLVCWLTRPKTQCSYCNSSPDQAPPVLYLPTNSTPTLKEGAANVIRSLSHMTVGP